MLWTKWTYRFYLKLLWLEFQSIQTKTNFISSFLHVDYFKILLSLCMANKYHCALLKERMTAYVKQRLNNSISFEEYENSLTTKRFEQPLGVWQDSKIVLFGSQLSLNESTFHVLYFVCSQFYSGHHSQTCLAIRLFFPPYLSMGH